MRFNVAKGLSLVELMISLLVGSIITAGVVQLYSANSETYRLVAGQSRMQESARFALAFIERDVQTAGNMGCFSSNRQLHWTADDPSNIPYEFDLRSGIKGYNGAVSGSWLPSLGELPGDGNTFPGSIGINISTIVSGTDVLTVRSIKQQVLENRLANSMPTSREPIEIVAPNNGIAGLGFAQLDLALIHDCEKATIFQVTEIDQASAAPNVLIGHETNQLDPWRNSILTLAVKNTFGVDAVVSGIDTRVYYIAPGSGQNKFGDNTSSLWRKSGTSPPVELVEGIEDLQLLFGVAVEGSSIPSQYLTANLVANWMAISTLRVTVVANSVEDVGASTPDGLIRRAFTQTIMLRNGG